MNLEQQKKQARELLREIRVGNEAAISRLRRHHSRWTTVDEATLRQLVALHDAQFILAREQGFASWPKLKAYAVPSSHSRHTLLFVADVAWITDRVHGLMQTRQSAGPAALEQIREWHPRFADRTDEEIRQAPFTEEDARLVSNWGRSPRLPEQPARVDDSPPDLLRNILSTISEHDERSGYSGKWPDSRLEHVTTTLRHQQSWRSMNDRMTAPVCHYGCV